MFKRLNTSWKMQKAPLSDKHLSKKPMAFSPQTSASSQASFSSFLKRAYTTNYSFFTFKSPYKAYGYQQRFISTSKMDPIKWQTLLNTLRDNDTSLSQLDLGHKQLGNAGAEELAMALKDNHTLSELDLEDNQIGDTGAKALAIALKENRALTSLKLNSNVISETGATELAIALKTNHTLTKLNLWGNQIGDAGVTELATVLKTNQTLTELNLRNNRIGASGGKALAMVLKDNRSLTIYF